MAADKVFSFGIIDSAVFCLVLFLSLCIGIYYACSGGKQRTAQEFLLGNRQMSWIPVAFSIFASFTSAIALLSGPSEIYAYGSQYTFMIVGYFFVILVTSYLYLPVYFKLGSTSVYEYLERRFNKTIRKLAAATFLLQTVMYLAVVIYAPSLALSHATGIHVWASAAVVACICTVYTTIGGIKAVIWTDVLQTMLTFIAMAIIAVKGCLDLGGFTSVWNANQVGGRIEFFNISFDPRRRQTLWTQSLGALFTWLSVFGISQTQVQRYMSMPTRKAARKALWAAFIGLSLNIIICTFVGFTIYAQYKDCDPVRSGKLTSNDQLLPLYAMQVLGIFPGLPGLFVAGLLSGSLSTLSSGLNSMSAVVLEDFVKVTRLKHLNEEKSATLAKTVAFVFGILCLVMVAAVENVPTLAEASLGLFGMIGGPMVGLFSLGMFCPCANSWGASVGVVVSLLFTCWIGFGAMIQTPPSQKLSVSVDGCSVVNHSIASMFNASTLQLTIQPTVAMMESAQALHVENTSVSYFHQIAFMWYSVIGCVTVLIVGCLVSCLTCRNRSRELDPRLFSPVVLKFLRSPEKSNPPSKDIAKDDDNEEVKVTHREFYTKPTSPRVVQETQL